MTLGFRVEKGLPKILRGLTRGVRTPLARQLRGQKSHNFQNFGTSELKNFLGNKKLVRKKNAKKSLSSKIVELKNFFWEIMHCSEKKSCLGNKKFCKNAKKKFSACGALPGLFYFPLLEKISPKFSLSSKILALKIFLEIVFFEQIHNKKYPLAGD